MQYKPNQRVSYYRVDSISDGLDVSVKVGGILIDRPRGEVTQWDFQNFETGAASYITGTRIGFAKVDPVTMKPVPEPSLAAVLDIMKQAEADG